jgi:hypothetical protein
MFFNELSQTNKFQCRVSPLGLDEDPELMLSDDEIKDDVLDAYAEDPDNNPLDPEKDDDAPIPYESFPGEHDVVEAMKLIQAKGCTLWTGSNQYMTCSDLKQKQCSIIPTYSNTPTPQHPNTPTFQHSTPCFPLPIPLYLRLFLCENVSFSIVSPMCISSKHIRPGRNLPPVCRSLRMWKSLASVRRRKRSKNIQ